MKQARKLHDSIIGSGLPIPCRGKSWSAGKPVRLVVAFTLLMGLMPSPGRSQAVPATDENIPFLVTFGKDAGTKWGDDDYSQVFFFTVPKGFTEPFYIRVFDPDCVGQHDEGNGGFNTVTKFSLYGGAGCITNPDARGVDPTGDYRSGNQLASKVFSADAKTDNGWYTFGPINPKDGELELGYGGQVFKLICEGIKGDDGNLYRYFMSTKPDQNVPVEGGNAFTFEYSFRLHADHRQISHIYPFIDNKTISVMQHNFDWDNEGYIKLVSVSNAGEYLLTSKENEWISSKYVVNEKEKMKSLDIQFKKDPSRVINNNNVVFYLRNQYGESLPFYTIPIGGIPRPSGTMKIEKAGK